MLISIVLLNRLVSVCLFYRVVLETVQRLIFTFCMHRTGRRLVLCFYTLLINML